MKIAKHLIIAVTTIVSLDCLVLAQNNNNNAASRPPETPKPAVTIPPTNRNALTPADKNFGGTSIYLINKKVKSKQLKAPPKTNNILNPTLPKSGKPSTPPTGTMIDSGDDASGKNLVPKSWIKPLHHFNEEFVFDSAVDVPSEQAPHLVAVLSGSVQNCVVHVGAARSNFVLFSGNGQSISNDLIGRGEPIVVGSAGSIISTDDGLITIHNGLLIVDSGRAPLAVANREAGIAIPPESTVAVEYTPGSLMTVYCLATSHVVKARTAANPNHTSELRAGQKLVLDVGGSKLQSASQSELDEFKTLTQKAPYSRLSRHLNTTAASSGSQPVRLIAAAGSEFYVKSSGQIELLSGWIFVDAPTQTQISGELADVIASKHAYLNIQKIPGYFRVGSCSGPEAVYVVADKYRIPLDRGEEALVCDHVPSDAEVAAGDGVLRRSVQAFQESNGHVILLDDFSIYSLLYNCNHLRPLRLAKTRTDRRTLDALVQIISEVQFSTAGRGDYGDQPQLGNLTPVSQGNGSKLGRSLISNKE